MKESNGIIAAAKLGMGGHQRPIMISEDWFTPLAVLSRLGRFDLDPCSSHARPWDTAARHYCPPEDDGLQLPWEGRCWVNPPYGKFTGRWMQRLAKHGNGIALIFARTETDDWQRYVWTSAQAILFIRGRLTFYSEAGNEAKHNSGAPSALIAYGGENVAVLMECGIAGALVLPGQIIIVKESCPNVD